MENRVRNLFPMIALAVCAVMQSCGRTQKTTDGAMVKADTMTSSADSLPEAQSRYLDGFIFIHYARCEESDEGNGYLWVSADQFCLRNYEFPTTGYYSCLTDSNDVLYYCPGTQDDIYYRGYLPKEAFNLSTLPVKAYADAPDSWQNGQLYTFRCNATGYIKKVRKIRINDPKAVLVLDEKGKTESLYGKYVYTVRDEYGESVFYRNVLDVKMEKYDQRLSLAVNDKGYFCIADDETHQVTPTSEVEQCHEIPTFSYLYFIDDSTITIDQRVYHRVEEQRRIVFDSNIPLAEDDAPSADALRQISDWIPKGSYTVMSNGGRYRYDVEVLADSSEESPDFIAFHAVKISCADQVRVVKCGEFHQYGESRYKADASHPFYTIPLDNGCTLLLFEKDERPFSPHLMVFALKDGQVTQVYDESGYIQDMIVVVDPRTIKLLSQMEMSDHEIAQGVVHVTPAHYYYLTIEGGRLVRNDYK